MMSWLPRIANQADSLPSSLHTVQCILLYNFCIDLLDKIIYEKFLNLLHGPGEVQYSDHIGFKFIVVRSKVVSMHPVQNDNSQIPLSNRVFNSICIKVQGKNTKSLGKKRGVNGVAISRAQCKLCTR